MIPRHHLQALTLAMTLSHMIQRHVPAFGEPQQEEEGLHFHLRPVLRWLPGLVIICILALPSTSRNPHHLQISVGLQGQQ